MTGAEHIAQRELVAASLLADEQREHHHDVYTQRRPATTPGGPRGDGARSSASPQRTAASDAPASAGAALDPAHECPACRGAGEIGFNPGYPDPQRADSMPCGDCRGTGVGPAP
jgi:hypothetical protein